MTRVRPVLRIELFGIPRARAGVSETLVELPGEVVEFGDLPGLLAPQFPALARECFAGRLLRDGYSANVNGLRFLRRPEEPLRAGETVLLFSADAGG